jgi:hypothetical protein
MNFVENFLSLFITCTRSKYFETIIKARMIRRLPLAPIRVLACLWAISPSVKNTVLRCINLHLCRPVNRGYHCRILDLVVDFGTGD